MSFFLCCAGSSEPPPATAPHTPSFGLAVLCELFENDKSAILGLLGAAIASIHADLRALEGSADAHDRQTVLEAAHRLKGTSGSIGAQRLVDISSQIEAAVTRTPTPLRPALVLDLRAAVAQVSADIAAYARSRT